MISTSANLLSLEQLFEKYYIEEYKNQLNEPSPLLGRLTKEMKPVGNSYTGGYGPLYRIPVQRESANIGDYTYRDVTKKQARAYLKGLRKHARQVEKALAG